MLFYIVILLLSLIAIVLYADYFYGDFLRELFNLTHNDVKEEDTLHKML